MNQTSVEHVTQSVVEFCRFTRSKGLSGGLHRSLAALRAVKAVGTHDRESLRFALRAALCSSKADWDLFDALFKTFEEQSQRTSKPGSGKQKTTVEGSSQWETPSQYAIGHEASDTKPESEGKTAAGASVRERLATVDFSQVPQNDLVRLEELSLRLLRQMSLRLSRRLKSGYRPGPIDLRRTIRRNLVHGGEPIALAFRKKKPQKNKLLIFLDVSGSMNAYSVFLLKFAYALQKHFRQVVTFLFSTSLVEISDALWARRLSDALAKLSQLAAGWSAGTKIGASLRELNRLHGRRLQAGNTIFMILSDGWDTGAPEMLAAELRAVRRRVRRIIWLNPLLGLADYEPVTRGMSAALPHIDVFAPAHNLESLLALEKHLQNGSGYWHV
jgi:uncharacterized protein with von Willebrand factor type A (vWA) domain